MNRYLKTIGILFICTLMLGGCNLFPEPSSLIQVPKSVKTAEGRGFDFLSVAKRNLPKGTELSIPNGPVGAEPIIYSDFDGDGNGEILVFYHSLTNQNQVGAFLLKKEKNNWEKVFAKKGIGNEINWTCVTDVTGDGKDEILIGWQSGVSAGNELEVFTWKKGNLVKLVQLPYNDIETIRFDHDQKSRLALWNRDLADVYKIQLLVWDGKTFVSDIAHYPSYYKKVIDYYNRRTAEVPDVAYYWYYLADAYYKASLPELALDALNKGMSLKTVVPSLNHFKELKDDIEMKVKLEKSNPVRFELSDPDLSFDVPRNIAPYITTNTEQGEYDSTVISVDITPDKKKKSTLFTIEVFPKDIIDKLVDLQLEKVGETETHIYYVRNRSNPKDEVNNLLIINEVEKENIISSIRLGTVNSKFISLEDQKVINLLSEASKKYWYVMTGGKMPEGKVETTMINNQEFRFLGKDLDTNVKLADYLSSTYTADSIQSFKNRMQIFEYFGRMVQPNADSGSLMNYQFAEVVQKKDNGNVKEFDLKAPLGHSFNYEVVHIGFQKTEKGWRIFSEPGTF